MKQNYQAVKQHFESPSELRQRGNITQTGLLSYAAHLLDRLEPSKGAKLLEIGCGDGLPMRKLKELRPDLKIDGIDISSTLTNICKENNPDSLILQGNILDMDLPMRGYDIVFSFSFLQYIPLNDIFRLQKRLIQLVSLEGGQITHCSIPDKRLKILNIAELQVRKYGWKGWFRTLGLTLPYSLLKGDNYGGNGYWHDPSTIVELCMPLAYSEVLSADVYYRFDWKSRINYSPKDGE